MRVIREPALGPFRLHHASIVDWDDQFLEFGVEDTRLLVLEEDMYLEVPQLATRAPLAGQPPED